MDSKSVDMDAGLWVTERPPADRLAGIRKKMTLGPIPCQRREGKLVLDVRSDDLLQVFFRFHQAFQAVNVPGMIQALELLRGFSQSVTIPCFPELIQYHIPDILSKLLAAGLPEVAVGVLHFVLQLFPHSDRGFLRLLAHNRFVSSLLAAATRFEADLQADFFHCIILFVPIGATDEILRHENIVILFSLLNNREFSNRKLAAKILVKISTQTLTKNQQRALFDFVHQLIDKPNHRDIWELLLRVPILLIRDSESALFVLHDHRFFEVARHLLFQKKECIIVNSLRLLGSHFQYLDDGIDVPIPRICRLAGSSHDHAARYSLWMVSNMMKTSRECVGEFIAAGIIEGLKASISMHSIRCKFEAVCVMSEMICEATDEEKMFCVESGLIQCLCGLLQVHDVAFITAVADPLVALLGTPHMGDQPWTQFMEAEGTGVIDEIIDSDDQELAEHGQILMDAILELRPEWGTPLLV